MTDERKPRSVAAINATPSQQIDRSIGRIPRLRAAIEKAVSFLGKLDAGELLTGTPTVTAAVGSGLTLSNKTVNSEAITINSVSHAIGQAVQFKVDATAATAGEWAIDITCATDNGQTVFGRVTVDVETS